MAESEQLVIDRVSIDTGLSDFDVWSVAQDQLGFMWFGTRHGGLSRFDGYDVRSFQHDPDTPSSLAHNYVWTLLVDHAGTLWIGTNGGGLDKYDPTTETFVHFGYDAADPARLPHSNIKALLEDSRGQFWIGSRGGLSLLDRATGIFTTLKHDSDNPHSPAGNDIRSIMEDADGNRLWLGTRRNGISVYDQETGTFTHWRHDPEYPASLSNNSVEHIYRDSAGSIWIATRNGLNRFDSSTNGFVRYHHRAEDPTSPSAKWIKRLHEDRQGRLWVATRSGIDRYNRATDSFARTQVHERDPLQAIESASNTVFEDSVGAIWFGSEFQGALRLDPEPPRFQIRSNPLELDPKGTIIQKSISALLVDRDGATWVGYLNLGLDRHDGTGTTSFRAIAGDADSLIENSVTALAQDAAGDIWIGTGGGLSRYDGVTFTNYRHDASDPLSLSGNHIRTLGHDVDGGMWIGLQGEGVNYFDGQSFTRYGFRNADAAQFTTRYPQSILPGETGKSAWIGTNSAGLAHIDHATGTVSTHLLDPRNPGSPLHNFVRAIRRDRDGTLWLASNTGVFVFDPVVMRFTKNLTTADGLMSNTIMGIEIDPAGDVWIAYTRGMSRFTPSDGSIRNFDSAAELFGAANLQNVAAQDQEGKLIWGTSLGLLTTHPEKLRFARGAPPVVLTSLRILGGEETTEMEELPPPAPITSIDEKILDAGSDSFSVSFAALEYANPLGMRYVYMLEGHDRVWHQADAFTRTAIYSRVPPGSYVFRAKTVNGNGAQEAPGAALRIELLPEWWETNWFKGGLAGFCAALILLAFYIQQRVSNGFADLAKFPDQSPHPVLRFDEADQVTYSNPASQPLFENGLLSHAGRAPDDWKSTISEVRKNGKQDTLTYQNGEDDRHFSFTFSPLQQSKHINVYGYDITERVTAENRLRQSQKMETIGQLTGGIAHDFNNLLSVIVGNLELQIDLPKDQVQDATFIEKALNAADRGSRLTQRLLTLAQNQPLNLEPVDTHRLIFGLEDLLQRSLGGAIEIDFDIPDDTWFCLADASQLENVILNLTVNARDAMSGGGKLSISAINLQLDSRTAKTIELEPGDYVQLSVSDTGKGMDPDTLGRIFQPFFSTKGPGRGSGLGLTMVQGFASQSGGGVNVESTPGLGTTFRIYLPRSTATEEAVQLKPRPESLAVEGNKSILVVEDDPQLLGTIEALLHSVGYDVATASNAQDALTQIGDGFKPDLLLSDVQLSGGKSGFELANELETQLADLRVVFMSGYIGDQGGNSGIFSSHSVVLSKPFRREVLLREIQKSLEN